jgi:hypothetical protein
MLVKYNVTDASIAELRERYAIVQKVEDNAGLKKLKSDITEVRTLRTSVETTRKDLKKDALEFGRKVDAEAKRITAELLKIEEPMKEEQKAYEAKIAAEKAEKARIEAERIQKIQDKIDALQSLPLSCAQSSSDEIHIILRGLDDLEPFDYQEFTERHEVVFENVKYVLGELLKTALAREKEAAEVAERERLAEIERKELEAERERLAAEEALRKQEAARIEEEARVKREEEAAAEREKLEKERAEMEATREKERAERERRKAEQAAEDERLAEERRKLEEEKAALEKEKEPEPEPSLELEPGILVCPHCGEQVEFNEDGELIKVAK